MPTVVGLLYTLRIAEIIKLVIIPRLGQCNNLYPTMVQSNSRMKKHVKVYFDFFGYGIDSFIPCECCGSRAVDIHHIECRGMGGSKTKDKIENLMALCRSCHIEYGDKKHHMDYLRERHQVRMNARL